MQTRWLAPLVAAWAVAIACSSDRDFGSGNGGGAGDGGDAGQSPIGDAGGGTGGTPAEGGSSGFEMAGQGGQSSPAAGFELSTEVERIDVRAEGSVEVLVHLERAATHDEDIELSASELPDGVSMLAVTAGPSESEVTLTIAADATATPGDSADITIIATDGSTESQLVLPLLVRGQPGAIDTTFGLNGVVSWNGTGDDFNDGRILLLPDDRILVGGASDGATGQEFLLLRFTADGSLDKTFGTSGALRKEVGTTFVDAPAFGIRENGILVLGGEAIEIAGQSLTYAAAQFQATPDGMPDPNFGTDGLRTYDQSLIISDFNFENGHAIFVGLQDFDPADGIGTIGWLDAKGNLDPKFGTGGLKSWPALDGGGMGRVIRDGELYLASAGCGSTACLARFDLSGTPDSEWGTAGVLTMPIADARISDLSLNDSGQYVIVGEHGANDWLVGRVTRTGQVLTVAESFTTGDDNATNLLVDGAGYWVLGTRKNPLATPNVYEPILVHYDAEFQRDPEFGDGGILGFELETTFRGTMGVARQRDGRLIVATTVRGAKTLRLFRVWS